MRRINWIKNFTDYLISCYISMENKTDVEFANAANDTIWPECMFKMHDGKDMVQILIETNVVELLKHLKQYEELQKKEK